MNFANYITLQRRVLDVRSGMTGKIKLSSDGLRDTLLSEFLRSIQGKKDVSVAEMESMARKAFRITPAQSKGLTGLIEEGMHTLAEARRGVLKKVITTVPDFAYENLMAAHRVNYPALSADLRKRVVGSFRRIIAEGGGVVELRKKLEDSQIVAYEAETLSQTSLAMFDNDYSVTLGEEAGIKYYEYVGAKAQREFCKDRLGNSYTLSQIERMDNGQGLPVRTSCGGYRCQHGWVGNPFKK